MDGRIQTSANSRFSWVHVVPDECHIPNRLPSGIFPCSNTNIDHFFTVDVADDSGGFMPLSKVYSFELLPAGLELEFARHILGAQGDVWTEMIPIMLQAEYMTFSRAFAIAEVTWSPKETRDYDGFLRRLKTDERRLDQLGVNYRNSALGEVSGSLSQNQAK